jgi:hypothetical protein
MEKSSKRGKIPQSDWPLIMARYEAGETLSSIARTYDCSPPAISYIVSRSRGKSASEMAEAPAAEPQLVKTNGNGATVNGSAPVEPTVAPPAPVAETRRDLVAEPHPVRPSNDTSTNDSPSNGDQRRKLHLSLGNGNGSSAPGNGSGQGHELPVRPSFMPPRPAQPQGAGAGDRDGQRPFQARPHGAVPLNPGSNGRDLFAMPEGRPAAQQPREAETARKDTGAFIDRELRTRVDGDIAAFLAAFDAALEEDTPESRFGLREATDRLLRAGARTRIELERLEARVPLTPRESGARHDSAAWRYR